MMLQISSRSLPLNPSSGPALPAKGPNSDTAVIPRHPHENPHVPEGRYDAIVHDVRVVRYGHDRKNVLVKITLHLPDGNRYLITHIDLPQDNLKMPLQRLASFCAVIGCQANDILNNPFQARGQTLRVYIRPVDL